MGNEVSHILNPASSAAGPTLMETYTIDRSKRIRCRQVNVEKNIPGILNLVPEI